MRIGAILAGMIGVLLVAGVSAAQAGNLEQDRSTLGAVALGINDGFAPTQFATDGSVYGVRARGVASIAKTINPTSKKTVSTSTTPDDCSTAGFPGGWCNTARSVAINTFGWNGKAGGKGVIIGMIDTGIDLNNVEFAGRVLPGDCVKSGVNPCTSKNDKLGGDDAIFPTDSTHGTHTTGIAAGANVGIANKASILPVKVCGSFVDSCQGITTGIVWAAQHGADIISVSIGGGALGSSEANDLRTAVADGALIVVAAGNSGPVDPTNGSYAGAALLDGIRGSMIVVGATGCSVSGTNGTNCANKGKGTLSSFSQTPANRCQVQDGQSYCMKDYFVVAPGTDIWSSVGNGSATASDYGYLSGTSMATPYVSGTAAVIKGKWPTLTASQVASIIFQTTDDLGAPGVDPVYGRGEVDIKKALSPVGATIVANKSFSVGSAKTASAGATTSAASPLAGMNGDATAAASLNKLGVGGAQQSLVSGPLSVAVRNSKILKNAVLVDSFGRTFQADLTKATYNPGIDFVNYFLSDPFTTFSPFAIAGQGPFGQFVASGYAVDNATPRLLSGEFLTEDRHRYNVRDLQFSGTVADGVTLNAGYNLDLQGRFNGYDLQGSDAYDGLFLSGSAMNSPYESFTDGGSFVGATVALASDLRMNFGESALGTQRGEFEVPVFSYLTQVAGPQTNLDQRTASTTMAGMDWDFASWGGLGVTASNTNEKRGLLGGVNSGALALSDGANTSALGLSARIGFGSGWVTTVSYSEGISQLDLRASSLASDSDTLHSRAYGVAVAKHGLFAQNDSLGLAVSRPIQVYSGGVSLTAGTSIDDTGNLLTSSEHVSLASSTPETDFEMGYVTTFFDGSLALQANAAWQQNLAGQQGVNSLAVLSRAKINF